MRIVLKRIEHTHSMIEVQLISSITMKEKEWVIGSWAVVLMMKII